MTSSRPVGSSSRERHALLPDLASAALASIVERVSVTAATFSSKDKHG